MSVSLSSSAPPPTLNSIAAWRILLVGVIALLILLGQLYIVLPILDAIEVLPGASVGVAPAALTAFALPYAVGFLLLGPLSDRFDPRTVMAASLAVALIATLGAGLAPSWGWFLLARAVQGVSAAPFTPAILLVITTRVVPARRLVTTSSVISAGMAAAIFAQVIAQFTVSRLGMQGLFISFAAALGGCLILLLALIPARPPLTETARSRRPALMEAYRPIPKILADPQILLLLFAAVSYLTVFVGLYAALQLAGPAAIEGHETLLLIVRASATPAMIAVPLLTPLLVRHSGRRRLLTAVSAGAAASLMLGVCALAGALSVTVFGMLVVAAALAAPATVTLVMGAAPNAGAAANALYSSAIFGGASLGAPLAASVIGVLGQQAGFGAFALTSAGLLTSAMILAAFATRRRRGRKQ